MRAGTTQVELLECTTIVALAQQRAGAEHLVQAQRAVEDVAADQADAALQVEWTEGLVADHAAREIRRVVVDGVDHELGHGVAVRVPAAVHVGIHLLAEQAGDMLARGRKRVVESGRNQHFHDGFL